MTYFSGAARPTAAATSIANLRTFGPASQFVDGMISHVLGGGLYEWNGANASGDNGTTIIKPTAVSGAGRWLSFAGGTGTQGFQGAQGVPGFQGSQGNQGFQGIQGNQGVQGFQGVDGNAPVGSGTIVFPTTAGSADATAFTVPASPTGAGRFLLTIVLVRETVLIVGSGTVALRVGTTTGGNELMTDQVVSSATTVGTIVGGQDLATLGLSLIAGNGYSVILPAGTAVKIRATTTGTLSAGQATLYVYGSYIP